MVVWRKQLSAVIALGAVLALTAAGAFVALEPALSAPDSSSARGDGCVSEAEYLKVARGMTERRVGRMFGTTGVFGDGAAGGYTRVYGRCGSPTGTVVVGYAATPRTAKVSSKAWKSVTRGDVRVLQGNDGDNAIDPGELSNRRRDHIYAGGGDDWVTYVNPDGYPDVIRCGAGEDRVTVIAGPEDRDRYIGCEHFDYLGE